MTIGRMATRVCVAMIALSPFASADVFSTGFEPPTYSLGPLAGQDGWASSAVPVVENSTVFAGSQALAYNSTGITGQDLASHTVTYNAGGIVDLGVEFMEGAGTEPVFDVLAALGNLGFIAQLTISSTGDAEYGPDGASMTTGSVPITPGVWNHYDLVLDFQNDTATAFINSTLIGSGAFATPSTGLAQIDIGVNDAAGDDAIGYFDNLSVTTPVPEPSAVILCITMLSGLVLSVRTRISRRGCKSR